MCHDLLVGLETTVGHPSLGFTRHMLIEGVPAMPRQT
jgi:hypothetical protein